MSVTVEVQGMSSVFLSQSSSVSNTSCSQQLQDQVVSVHMFITACFQLYFLFKGSTRTSIEHCPSVKHVLDGVVRSNAIFLKKIFVQCIANVYIWL